MTKQLAAKILDEADNMLRESDGRRLNLSEIAARLGIAQSYVYRFYDSKSDLIRALAARWFVDVEKLSETIANSDHEPKQKFEDWIVKLLQAKRDKYDQNPVLFDAYLGLAAQNPEIVAIHSKRLAADMAQIISEMVPARDVDKAITLAQDATILFRIPHNISQFRAIATDERAKAVVHLLVDNWKA